MWGELYSMIAMREDAVGIGARGAAPGRGKNLRVARALAHPRRTATWPQTSYLLGYVTNAVAAAAALNYLTNSTSAARSRDANSRKL